MGDVLEFQSARRQVHHVLLRQLGVPRGLAWRILGTPRDRFWLRSLYSAPLVVATRRDGAVLVVDLHGGCTPHGVPDSLVLQSALDATVVGADLRRRGTACENVESWISYDDGGRFEIRTPGELRMELCERSQRAMRRYGLRIASTAELAKRWAPFPDDTAHAS